MNKLEQAARQLLSVLENGMIDINAVTTLREALAEQAEQEPIGYLVNGEFYKTMQFHFEGGAYENQTPLYAAPVQPVKQEPVMIVQVDAMGIPEITWDAFEDYDAGRYELYAAPLDAKAIRAEALEEAAKVCEEAMIQMNYSEAPYKQCAAAIRARGEK